MFSTIFIFQGTLYHSDWVMCHVLLIMKPRFYCVSILVGFYVFAYTHVFVQMLSIAWFFAILGIAAYQAPLAFTISWSLLKFMSIELVTLYTFCIKMAFLKDRDYIFRSTAPFKCFYGFMETSDIKIDFPIWPEILEPGHSVIHLKS